MSTVFFLSWGIFLSASYLLKKEQKELRKGRDGYGSEIPGSVINLCQPITKSRKMQQLLQQPEGELTVLHQEHAQISSLQFVLLHHSKLANGEKSWMNVIEFLCCLQLDQLFGLLSNPSLAIHMTKYHLGMTVFLSVVPSDVS